MDKEAMIREIMDMITPLPPEEQQIILDMIRDFLESIRKEK